MTKAEAVIKLDLLAEYMKFGVYQMDVIFKALHGEPFLEDRLSEHMGTFTVGVSDMKATLRACADPISE